MSYFVPMNKLHVLISDYVLREMPSINLFTCNQMSIQSRVDECQHG